MSLVQAALQAWWAAGEPPPGPWLPPLLRGLGPRYLAGWQPPSADDDWSTNELVDLGRGVTEAILCPATSVLPPETREEGAAAGAPGAARPGGIAGLVGPRGAPPPPSPQSVRLPPALAEGVMGRVASLEMALRQRLNEVPTVGGQ